MNYEYYGKMNALSFLNLVRFKIVQAQIEEQERRTREALMKGKR